MATTRPAVQKRVRATIRIPRALYEEVRGAVRARRTRAGNVNDFILFAMRAYIRLIERRRIDHAFRGMADDRQFQKEARAIAEEFSASDWEAFELGESHQSEAGA